MPAKKYELYIKTSARKEMRNLPKDVLQGVHRAIRSLRQEPRPRGCRKVRGREGAWRIVVRKDYRVLYMVDDTAWRIEIYSVARREKDTYR